MRISVALCTYNGAAFVEEQVRSILTQVPEPDELVVGDDASADDTVAIIERVWAEHHAAGGRTELLLQRNSPGLGVAANFADAAERASGDIVVLSDQDDVWHPGKIAAIAAAFESDPQLRLVHTDAHRVDEHGTRLDLDLLDSLEASRWERRHLAAGDGFRVLLRRNLVTGMTAAVRRDLVAEAFPVGEGWIHDEWLAIIAAATGRVRLIPRVLADYRQHGKNQIGASRPTLRQKFGRLREEREPRATEQVVRAESLVEAFERLGDRVPPARLTAVRARLAHRRWRRGLPTRAVPRFPRIVAHVLRGEYSRYSYGWRDIARDVFQPHRPASE